MPVDPDRQRALLEAKLRALVREHFGVADAAMVSLANGAAVLVPGRLWVYQPADARRLLGQALALAAQRDAAAVDIIVDADKDFRGVIARRAAVLTPAPAIWELTDRTLGVAAPVARDDADALPGLDAAPLVALLRDAGAEVIIEHGVVSGEVLGLQIARIGAADDGSPRLFVGVGRFDQEATQLLYGDLPPHEALARAIVEVRRHRRPEAAPHPVNRLARERWLRAQIVAQPATVGLHDLECVAPPEPRRNVRDPIPAAALGRDDARQRVLLVCSVGVDLDLIPFAADLVDRERPHTVLFAMPERDDLDVQHKLATRLPVPTSFVAVEGDWPQ